MSFYHDYASYKAQQAKAAASKKPIPINPWIASPATPAAPAKSVTPAIPAASTFPAPMIVSTVPSPPVGYQLVSPITHVYQQPQPAPQIYYAAPPAPEPVQHNFWYGGAKANGNTRVQLIPQNAIPGQQFYCKELDESYTLRSLNEIMQTLQPGYWATAKAGGYPYWIRKAKKD